MSHSRRCQPTKAQITVSQLVYFIKKSEKVLLVGISGDIVSMCTGPVTLHTQTCHDASTNIHTHQAFSYTLFFVKLPLDNLRAVMKCRKTTVCIYPPGTNAKQPRAVLDQSNNLERQKSIRLRDHNKHKLKRTYLGC